MPHRDHIDRRERFAERHFASAAAGSKVSRGVAGWRSGIARSIPPDVVFGVELVEGNGARSCCRRCSNRVVAQEDLQHHHCVAAVRADDQGRDLVSRASDMVRESILPQWGAIDGCAGTSWEMGRRAGEWLLAMHERHVAVDAHQGRWLEIGFDYSTDFELLEYAIRDAGLWDRVREVIRPVNVGGVTGSIESELAAEECFLQLRARKLGRHHALADALALRAGYLAVKARLTDAFGKGSNP